MFNLAAAEAEHVRRLAALADNPYVEFLDAGAPVATHRLIVESSDAAAFGILNLHGFAPLADRSRFEDATGVSPIDEQRIAAMEAIERESNLSVMELVAPPRNDGGPSKATIAAATLSHLGHLVYRAPYLNLGPVDMGPAGPPMALRTRPTLPPIVASEGHPSVIVAVFDSGLPSDYKTLHKDLDWLTMSGPYDVIYDPPSAIGDLDEPGAAGHGLFVSSIIARHTQPTSVPIRVFESTNQLLTSEAKRDVHLSNITFSTLVGAAELAWDVENLHNLLVQMEVATHRASIAVVVNMSLGGRTVPSDVEYLKRVMKSFVQKRESTVFCLAAGNKADLPKGDDGTRKVYPAAFSEDPVLTNHVASVGALDPQRNVAEYSGRGDWVNAWAPGTHEGEYVVGTWTNTTGDQVFQVPFAEWSGTSFATPVVAAAIASASVSSGDPIAAWTALKATMSEVTWTGVGGSTFSQQGTDFS